MEKEQGFMGEGKAGWNSCSQTNEVNCCFVHPNWDNSMDQSGPFESALSSMACSPAASNAGSSNFPGPGDNAMMRELVGKLGNIRNTYTCALNSPPKLNLSMVDSHMRGNLKFSSVPGVDSSIKGQSDANARKKKSAPSPAPAHAKMPKEDKQQNGNVKAANDGNQKQNKETPKDYIHVKARRGQATDSHSLAERVRREKISERMKFLQDLVPGCNKVSKTLY